MKILVVDDEVELAMLCGLSLRRAGHEVVVATDPRDALDLLSADVDAVVTDFDMPRLNGVEMVARMRRVRPNLIVIFSTGREAAELSADVGEMDQVVSKDGNFRETMSSILSLLEAARAQPQALFPRAESPSL